MIGSNCWPERACPVAPRAPVQTLVTDAGDASALYRLGPCRDPALGPRAARRVLVIERMASTLCPPTSAERQAMEPRF